MTEHPALVALAMIDAAEINSSDQTYIDKLRALLETLAGLPWSGEDGPAAEPDSEPDVGTNA